LHVFLGLIALLIFLWLAWQGDFAPGRRESAFKSVGYYCTLSMSSGSLFYLLFTSFRLFDDYLSILHYRLDVDSIVLILSAVALIGYFLAFGNAAGRSFRRCARGLSFRVYFTV